MWHDRSDAGVRTRTNMRKAAVHLDRCAAGCADARLTRRCAAALPTTSRTAPGLACAGTQNASCRLSEDQRMMTFRHSDGGSHGV